MPAADSPSSPDSPDSRDSRVQYVCIVCFATAAVGAGVCVRDGAPLSPVANADVVAALRARVQRRSSRREAARFGLALVAGAALSAIACVAFGWQIVPRAADGLYSSTFAWLAIVAAIVLGALSLPLVRPLPTDGDTTQLLAQLGLDKPR
jgi:hypothetical protein